MNLGTETRGKTRILALAATSFFFFYQVFDGYDTGKNKTTLFRIFATLKLNASLKSEGMACKAAVIH